MCIYIIIDNDMCKGIICSFCMVGLNPIPSEAQMRALDKLNTKLHTKHTKSTRRSNSPMASSSSGWEEEEIQFDLKSATRNRVILFEGKVQKKSKNYL